MEATKGVKFGTAALGILVGGSAVMKLAQMGVFQAAMALSGLVPGPIVPVISWAIAIVEAAAAVVVLGAYRRPLLRYRALWLTAFLITAFLAYDLTRLALGIRLPGPYFGPWSLLPPQAEAALTAVVLAATVWLLARVPFHGPETQPSETTPTMSPPDGKLVAVLAITLVAAACNADGTGDVIRGMRRSMAAIGSVSADIAVTWKRSAGYLAALHLKPGETLPVRHEWGWAWKGAKWRFDEHDASRKDENITYLFDGTKKLIYSNYPSLNYTRGTFVESNVPLSATPLSHAYSINGRPAPDVLQADGFRLVRVEQHPSYGALYVLQGHEFGVATSTTTVWVAGARGYQIVRMEMRSNRMGKIITRDRTDAIQQVAGIWLPCRIVREVLYPGRESTATLLFSNMHVNDVPDSRFQPSFMRHASIFSHHVPLQLRFNGTLGIDPRGTQLDATQSWSDGPKRLAVGLCMFLGLWILVVSSAHAIRRRTT